MSRFMRKGVTKVWFVPTIATIGAATAAEVNAGTEIGPELADVSGFSFSNSPISTPDMDNQFVAQVTGEDTADNSSLTMYDQRENTTLKDALAKGTAGYMVFFYSGIAGAVPAVGDDYEVFPVDVSANVRLYSAGNEAAQYRVDCAITAVPVEGTVA